jgi:hypothetical protein
MNMAGNQVVLYVLGAEWRDYLIAADVRITDIEVLRIATGEAHFWTMNDILRERELERIKF